MNIEKHLQDLEKRIDPIQEENLMEEWKEFNRGQLKKGIFTPQREKRNEPALEWPDISINEALEDYDKMALSQLKRCSAQLKNGGGDVLAVRCNYGTSIIPSLFGVDLFIMDEDLDTLPTSRPLPGGKDDVKELLDQGIPDLTRGLGEKVFKMGERFKELRQNYPKLKEHVHIYHPDLQGPMDICEVLWGSDLFLDVNDCPELVLDFLDLITETYIKFMEKWTEIVPFRGDFAVHWGLVHRGNIMLRDDSAMNFSPAMYEKFIKPFDRKLFDEFGGGALHFCGRGDHYIESAVKIDKLYTVNMSQPDYNDMEEIFRHTIDQGIPLINFEREFAEKMRKENRDLKGSIHCRD